MQQRIMNGRNFLTGYRCWYGPTAFSHRTVATSMPYFC